MAKNIDELTLDEIREQMALYQRLYYKKEERLTQNLLRRNGNGIGNFTTKRKR
jgi:hypothetical protein